MLLLRLSEQQAQLNPLQGGFRAGFSCLHSAFIFQEAVSSMLEQKKKVFVAFLDVKKAFDTVWHAGLMVKLFQKNVALYIWHIINNWYSGSTSSVLWNLSVSRSFRIQQGVHQGSILYPLLYSTFVNELLDRLRASGYGVYIDDIYCGAPMYADDLTHFCIRPSTPARHGFCFYAFRWRYQLNAQKSSILVFGKSPVSWKQNRTNRKWLLSGTVIPERNTQHHLGILHRTVHSSSIGRTIERCSAGKSAFFAVSSMFGCLHPTTSFRLYFSFCISILLYGCELWSVTASEITMLERVHRKILRTIQGLPLRCRSKALQCLMGVPSILSLIQQRQLNFLYSLSLLPAASSGPY